MAGVGRRFVKGQIANPLGAGAHNPIKKQFKRLTDEHLREIMELLLHTHPSELQNEVNQDPTILKTWIAAAALKGINNGDLGPLLSILDRVLGRVHERIDVTAVRGDGEVQSPEEIEKQKARIAELIKKHQILDVK